MNTKLNCLALAIAASLASAPSFADDLEALNKRIEDLESKLEKSEYIYEQQQQVLTPEADPKLGFFFSGYARYGALYQSGDNKFVEVGSSGRSVGRLGNEYNGGEVQFAHVTKSDSGAIWDIVVMFDQWGVDAWGSDGGVNLKKMYAGATNFIASQPELYVWAGRDFHQRPQQGLNDYFWMTHDGQGAGFNNLVLGGVKLDMGFVGQVSSAGGALGNDNGRYAFTSKLHGINVGLGTLDLYYNYGFASSEAGAAVDPEHANQLGAVWSITGPHKVTAKYADGADNSAFDLAGDKQVFYISYEGSVNPSEQLYIDYLVSYKDIAGDDATDTTEYSAIVRPMYQWNNIHSTWFEGGYAMEDYADGGDKSGWKATISQNMSVGGLPWSRPMVRLYATMGDVKATGSDSEDTLSLGAMFEAWW